MFRVPEDYRSAEYQKPTIDTGKGRTRQSERDKADINLIMAKYQKTGMINFTTRVAPEFMEVEPVDLQTALNTVLRANEMFSEMPANMRKKFENNPQNFLEFVNNPENRDEMYELGLAVRPTAEPAVEPATATPEPGTPVEE